MLFAAQTLRVNGIFVCIFNQLAVAVVVAAAFKAACSLGSGLLGCEPESDLTEILFALVCGAGGHFCSLAVFIHGKVYVLGFSLGHKGLFVINVDSVKVCVAYIGAATGLSDCRDCDVSASVGGVAHGKNTVDICLVGGFVGNDVAPLILFDGVKSVGFYALAESRNNGIDRKLLKFALDGNGGAASAFVGSPSSMT